MKDKIKSYKAKLEQSIAEYMAMPANERSASAVRGMAECWEVLERMEHCICHEGRFTKSDAENWNAHMVNDDGTMGGHWSMAQTTAVAQNMGISFEHITEYCWNTAMNMMYSDYCNVASKYGVGTPEFYAEMAKAFLFDKDAKSPKDKMSAYYYGIVAVE